MIVGKTFFDKKGLFPVFLSNVVFLLTEQKTTSKNEMNNVRVFS